MPESVPQEVREDGALINVITGLGTPNKDRSVHTTVGFTYLLVESQLEELYKSGIPRRYVDAIADEMLRHLVTINVGEEDPTDDTVEQFDEFLKNIDFHAAYSEVVKLQRLYGGGGLVCFINDGKSAEEPVDLNNIKDFMGVAPLSRYELIPDVQPGFDYSKPEWYKITTTQRLTPDQTLPVLDIKVHASRIARFDGLYIPRRRREFTHGWGQSCVQLIWEAYKRYESAMSGLENMVGDPDTFIHKVPGLMNMLIAGQESKLSARLEANNLARSMYGGMLLDTEEEVEYLQRTLNNLAQSTDPFMKELQAATGWPASILMGESPGGLGKEGRFEERVWSSLVEQWQTVYCKTPLTQVFTYILASKSGPTRGQFPEGWAVHFPAIFTKTDEERAAIYSQMAAADAQYINLQVLNPLEVRQSRFAGTEFSLETNLDDTVTQQLELQQQANHESTMINYQAQAEAMLNPPEAQAQPGAPAQPAANKQDSADYSEAHGYRIRVTHFRAHAGSKAQLGYLVGPDNARIDSPDGQPTQMILGPDRNNPHDLYRVRFDSAGELTPGPYLVGFSSINHARDAAKAFFPRQTVAGLTRVSAPERESLRAAWEVY